MTGRFNPGGNRAVSDSVPPPQVRMRPKTGRAGPCPLGDPAPAPQWGSAPDASYAAVFTASLNFLPAQPTPSQHATHTARNTTTNFSAMEAVKVSS